MRRLFILRPQPGADATAERARAMGLDPVVVSLFRVEQLDWSAPDPAGFDGLLLTSANAVRHGGAKLERFGSLPVHAVGEATAAAASAAGFVVATTGANNLDTLLASLPEGLSLLHLCGADRREPASPSREIMAVPVYRSAAVESPDLTALSGQAAMIHSPRAAARLAELVEDRSAIRLAAISAAAAEAAGDGWERVAVAAAPHDAALLVTAVKLCDKVAGQ